MYGNLKCMYYVLTFSTLLFFPSVVPENKKTDNGDFIFTILVYLLIIFIFSDRLTDWHIVEIEVTGPERAGRRFKVTTTRNNPADPGAVTGTATYASFLSSMKRAGGQGLGVHLC